MKTCLLDSRLILGGEVRLSICRWRWQWPWKITKSWWSSSVASTTSSSMPHILSQCDSSLGLLAPKPALCDSQTRACRKDRRHTVHFLAEPLVHQCRNAYDDICLQVILDKPLTCVGLDVLSCSNSMHNSLTLFIHFALYSFLPISRSYSQFLASIMHHIYILSPRNEVI